MKKVVLCGLSFFCFFGVAEVQSTFVGPVSLKVWAHWQDSWNVEDVTGESWEFELTRGSEGEAPYVRLKYKTTEADLRATLQCRYRERTGTWENQVRTGERKEVSGENANGLSTFEFPQSPDCLDENEKRVVEEISFTVQKAGQQIYKYDLNPMYVRGKNQVYWNNPISAYSAHAGSGDIKVANAMKGELKWDTWQGTLVQPTLSFVDRNTMGADAVIGLHRHENNQEVYFMESGKAVMRAGIAPRSSGDYKTDRVFEANGKTEETTQFDAKGGWIESRTLSASELSVIVPKAGNAGTVYFHGIQALEDVVFWTMGTKN